MYIIAGLGNIGKKYENHRHNMGFMVLDAYAKKHDISFTEEKLFVGSVAKVADMTFEKPATFMNDSGLEPCNSEGRTEIEQHEHDIITSQNHTELCNRNKANNRSTYNFKL